MDIRFGILECDHVSPGIIKDHGDYDDMFVDLLHTQDNTIEFSVYDLVSDQFPIDLSSCDAYIITGSKYGVYEDIPWIKKAKKLVQRLYDKSIPTIGICFGHQLIADALGGKVVKTESKGRGLGVQSWQIKHRPDWMKDTSLDLLSLNACHQDQVIKLPVNSELLLSSDFCPIAGFQKSSMLGIQGHPEFDFKYTNYLLNKYKETLTEQALQKSKNSLKITANSDYIAAWMVDFIKYELKTNMNY